LPERGIYPGMAAEQRLDRSFERLYRRYATHVHRYAYGMLRNRADAEDVTQVTFMNAYRALERGERPRAPQNWLIAIAHNVCRQRFRQSQRRPTEVVYEDELAETVVEEDALSAEDIRRALGHLAFNQRSALVMRELEGRSYQEIAEILGVSLSAVETLIFRARRALREQLEEGITCREAEFAISRQLDGRLPRKEKGALRGHLRQCDECASFARSQRAQRGALKALAAIPLPSSLAGLFGGGGAATVGGGVAMKAALLAGGAVIATGVGYEGVKQGALQHDRAAATPVAAKAHRPTAKPPGIARAIPTVQLPARDQKAFRPAAPKVRSDNRVAVARARALGRAKPEHREVSALPPSRVRTHDIKPMHVKPPKPPHVKKPPHAKKPPPAKGPTGEHGNGGARGPTGEHGKLGR
jgi:RNA polymerase sigma factor (sigma-70 family)